MSDSNLPEPEIPDAGIPEEDQQALRAEIERVAAENRIRVTDDTFAVTAIRKGYRMPLIVNLGAVVLGVTLLMSLSAFFRSEDQQVRAETGFAASAQGQIVAELRREAEQQLQAKDREIAEIERQLAQIRAEREQLADDIDERVRAREAELEARFEAEIAAERERLAEEGLSEDEINAIIAQIRADRIAEIDAEIAAYRAELEAQRDVAEADLDRQEQQFNQQLASANEERSTILAETERRERELRAQFEGRLAAQQAELTSVQQELTELSARREREQAALREITGFFATIRSRIADNQLDAAQTLAGELRAYLNDPSVRELRTVADRREADLTLLGALEDFIQLEREVGRLRDASTTAEFEALSAEYETLSTEHATLQDERERLVAERTSLEDELAELTAELEAIGAESAPQQLGERQQDLETQIDLHGTELGAREETITELEREVAALGEEIASFETELSNAAEQIALLSGFRDRLAALERAWNDYREYEPEGLESGDDPLALSEARIGLEAFLGREITRSVLPEFDSRIQRYFDAFEESGRERALMQSADLLFELALLGSTAERRVRVEQELESSSDGSVMSEFLQELALLLDSGN